MCGAELLDAFISPTDSSGRRGNFNVVSDDNDGDDFPA